MHSNEGSDGVDSHWINSLKWIRVMHVYTVVLEVFAFTIINDAVWEFVV